MIKKNFILSFSFATVVLLAIVLQGFHDGQHLKELFAEKQCNHKYNTYKTEISHAHHDFDHCFVCEFTFSSSLNTTLYINKLNQFSIESKIDLPIYVTPIVPFSGSQYNHRGPPTV